VTLLGAGWRRTQSVRAKASFQSTNDPRALFRLAPGERAGAVEVVLPGRAPRRTGPVPTGAYAEVLAH
jgi:hypothetical protein